MAAFDNGTRKLFNMAAAPTGWTKDTTAALNDSALMLAGGTFTSYGGVTAFSTVHPATAYPFTVTGAGSSSGTTSSNAIDVPNHTHTGSAVGTSAPYYQAPGYANDYNYGWPSPPGPGGGVATPVPYQSTSLPVYTSSTLIGAMYINPTTPGSTQNGLHSHPFTTTATYAGSTNATANMAIRYVDMIVATKNGVYGATWASQTVTTVAKGGSVSITWNTPTATIPTSTTLYWTIVNTGMSGALSSNAMSGSFVTTGATFTQTITVTDNLVWDNGGSFVVQLRSDSIYGSVMASSQKITITESSPTATFTVTPTTINEGAAGTFTFTSTRLRNGELLTYTINNTTTSNIDFADSIVTGTVVVNSNTGTFSINPIIDLLVETTETFTVSLRTSSGLLLVTSASINVGDIPPTVTFTVTPTTITTNTDATFTITATNVPNGTGLTWVIATNSGGTFVNTTGTVYIYNNTGTFYVTPNSVRDSNKAFIVQAWTFTVGVKNSTGQTLNTSASVTVNNSTVSFVTPITSLNQGQTVNYNINTTNIPNGTQLLWKITPNIGNNAGFNTMQGYVTINNNAGSFGISATSNNDFPAVAYTTYFLDVYDYIGTFNLTTSTYNGTPAVSLTVNTKYPAATYKFITPPTTILEGTSATLQFISNVNTGTLYWLLSSGTTSVADFITFVGTANVTNASAVLTIIGVISGTVNIGTVIIGSGIPANTYIIAKGTGTGGTGTYTMSAAAVGTYNGISVTGSVMTSSITLNGSVIVDSTSLNQQYLQTLTITSAFLDNLVEPVETFNVVLLNNAPWLGGSIVATSETISIVSVEPNYWFVNAPNIINEGVITTFTVACSNTTGGTLYWDIAHTSTNASDFVATSGSFTSTPATPGTFQISTVADSVTEGYEYFTINIRTTTINTGPIVLTIPMLIGDTSRNPTYTFLSPTTSINEGVTTVYNFVTTDAALTTYYWTILNSTTSTNDFVTPISGSFTTTGTLSYNTGSFSVTTLQDALTEGNEQFSLQVRTGSITGTVIATSPLITIVDTSLNPTYSFSAPTLSINEGVTTSYVVNTTDVPLNTILFYTINYITASGLDFVPALYTNSVSFNGTTQYLGIASPTNLALGSGDFTVECWINPNNVTASQNIVCDWRTGAANSPPVLYLATNTLKWRYGAADKISSSIPINAGVWTHIAISRNSGTTRMFVNGVLAGSLVDSNNYTTDTIFQIGKAWDAYYFNGYISNLRIVKTSFSYSVPFSVSALPLSNITGTVLLACQGLSVASENSSTYTITAYNNPPLSSVSPFNNGSGSFYILSGSMSSGSGVFQINTSADGLLEGSETFNLQIRTGSVSGPVVATSPTITINDTSTIPITGQAEFTTSGNYSWVAPDGVTSICVLVIGAGGRNGTNYGGGGGGGGLAYVNNLSVTPGSVYNLQVGLGGGTTSSTGTGASWFNNNSFVYATAGGSGVAGTSWTGGGGGGAAGYAGNGGNGGAIVAGSALYNGGSGGTGGGSAIGIVAFNGGNGGMGSNINSNTYDAGPGIGGSGGGGAGGYRNAYGGGGVGIYGQSSVDSNGATTTGGTATAIGGNAAQATNGGSGGVSATSDAGGAFGGGIGARSTTALAAGGAVRIIWGPNRAFPSTNTQNM